LKVGIAQIKPKLLNIQENLKKHLECIEMAKGEGLDLLVFPELSLTGYLTNWMTPTVSISEGSKELDEILEKAKGISLIFGAIIEDRGQFYNSAIFVEDGKILGIHRKVYLPTYGMFDEGRYFTRGKSFSPIESKLGRFGVLICEDAWHLDAYLEYSQCDYIVIISNNPLRGVGERSSVDVWHTLAGIPSLFFGTPTIYANRVGVEDGIIFFGRSRIIDGDGRVLAEGKEFEEELVIAEINPYTSRAMRFKSATLRVHLNALGKDAR
jgi:predicted amidohydrolase